MRSAPLQPRRRVIAPGPSGRELRAHPAVRNYLFFCLTALFLVVACLVDRNLGWWCLVPAVVGVLTLLLHWSLGPPLVLAVLAGILGFSRLRFPSQIREPTPSLLDVLLCVAVMAYILGHYRLLSLVQNVFPTDPRQPGDSSDAAQRRLADVVNAAEMTLLGLAAPLWTGLALLVWAWMRRGGIPPWNMLPEAWRILRFVWMYLIVLAVATVVLALQRLSRAGPAASLLYLQDQVWRHTRREQGNLNRWVMWARLRARRKKEKP